MILVFIMAVACHGPARTEPVPAANVTPSTAPTVSPTVEVKTYQGVGIVKAINTKQLAIEIAHEDIKDLMPAMQMSFYVKDKSLLEGLKPGDQVEFTMENGVGGLKITEMKKRS